MAAEVSYLTKSEAHVERKPKTKTIEESCVTIIERHGTVTADLLVASATKADHPLHQYFDWDDSVAGRKWRKAQAMAMIIATQYVAMLQGNGDRKVKKVASTSEKAVQVRRFLPAAAGGFMGRAEALSDDECRKGFVDRKVGVLRSWCKSVVDVPELQTLRAGIKALLQ